MRVYFVRHGVTASHGEQDVHQKDSDELSETGHEQAQFLAKRFKELPVDRIYSSTYTRAAQTAEHIAKEINKEIIFSDLITEIRLPSEIIGKVRKNPDVTAIRNLVKEHFGENDWHYSDEENFADLKKRSLAFIQELESSNLERVLVVTHGGIMVLLILAMKFGEALSAELFLQMQTFFHINNTGITLMDNSYDHNWWLISWNDHGHLGYFYK